MTSANSPSSTRNHSCSVSTSTSPKVEYAYTSGSDNHIRPTKVTYPNGRIVRYEYNSGADNNLRRISFLADDASGSVGTHLAEYTYLGLGMVVKVDYTEPDNPPGPGLRGRWKRGQASLLTTLAVRDRLSPGLDHDAWRPEVIRLARAVQGVSDPGERKKTIAALGLERTLRPRARPRKES